MGKDTALILSASLLQLFPYLDENMSVDYLSPNTMVEVGGIEPPSVAVRTSGVHPSNYPSHPQKWGLLLPSVGRS